MTDPHPLDAYRYPRKIREGCTHQFPCKCDPPYWLRESSPAELEREAKRQPERIVEGER